MKKQLFAALLIASLSGYTYAQESKKSGAAPKLDVKSSAAISTEAPVLAAPVGNLYLNQWVHADMSESVRGSVVTLAGQDSISMPKVRVSLVKNGTAIVVDDTDVDGDFLLEGVTPGVYSLVAETANSISIFSLTVLDAISGEHLPNSVQVRLMSTEGGRVTEIIQGQTLPTDETSPVPTKDPLKGSRKVSDSHQVLLDAQGNMKGQLSRPLTSVDMSDMVVYVMKDGSEVSRAKVSSDGKFTVRGLSAGCYGLVAAGEQGVAASGFCATTRNVAQANAFGETFVGMMDKPLEVANFEVCAFTMDATNPPADNIAESNLDSRPAASPMMGGGAMGMPPGFGGGMGGGASGGGGFGSGGLGLGGLASIGGLIAVGIIAADDDEDNAPVVSPVVP
jgi:hypothetical protein